ncbi:hypothetical protein V6N11_015290 [Hibiscus sabdariffa]|uniref:Uncharacterized protein n=1 Tax=Hibiscus sabdariffa TaxID=183260 RepID=A0ABR2TRV7_9ROSI
MRDRERVKVGVGILKRECPTVDQRLAIVDKAVVVAKASERFGVDEPSGAEPATVQVNSPDVAAGDTDVHDLDSVGRNAIGEWRSCSLVDHYVGLATLLTSNSIRFLHCCSYIYMQKQ